ncbi:DNA mismatch repair endonuclease MutL [Halococcus saccharolyticus]|uniref:DNA mismatch repair protein MutL n=1 Tax=Halococcus saccharolyticus DSM 5350 TaxID=1227455 RepID=M0MP70_9EURY|nr:DNA mismatch repair endonuclease MutL [Halococcus saccharolyticus]EMA46509.1 DNA mismatch repair protein MutL [Halococcus saccharolyticus DSM 5350]
MTRITELDPETVERIAAGEVVTRPASVVTELVENSLDAGTSSVEVVVENAGLDLIRVADDGHGMTETDARLAVERHATSKIGGVEDVERVATLGFRGEALPSIAQVARLELTTKAAESGAAGTRVVVDGGEKTTGPAGRAVGTTISVTDLFANTPVRRKSLATPKREFARVSETVSDYALTHPDVRFSLTHDGRTVLSTPGSGSYTDAILGVYNREVAGQSTEFGQEDEKESGDDQPSNGVSVSGLVVYPSITRSTPAHVTTAINGRALDDPTVRKAVTNGYGTLLPDDRYPIAVVDVSLPPERVDVNVHPSKDEVAFADPDEVAEAVEQAIADALATQDLARTGEVALDLDSSLGEPAGESAFDTISVIGQFRGLYLLCEADDDLLVVDQHAAHERINFERLREALDDGISSVGIEPTPLSLTAAEAALVEANADALDALGFRIETDGGAYRATGLPAPLGRVAEPSAVHDVLDGFLAGDEPENPREELLKDVACHPSLKAGESLSSEDATRLVERLGTCEQPFACPHGRPTVLTIDEETFARGFERPNTRFD